MLITRRRALLAGLFGAGGIGLRALATGLPISFLLNPRQALAQGMPNPNAQFLLLATSGSGDPVNCNGPGCYVPGVVHPADPMNPTGDPMLWTDTVSIGGQSYTVAKPWATLPATGVLDRACFFHTATNTIVHPDQPKVLGLLSAVRRGEMAISLFCQTLSQQNYLNTIQPEPVPLSNEQLRYQGRALPNLSPQGLSKTLLSAPGALTSLQALRDRDLDAINAVLRADGTAAEKAFLDRMALSQQEVRQIPAMLLDNLSSIRDNGINNQILAAAVLFKMNVTPAVTINIGFGGDNHGDIRPYALGNEAASHISGVAAINQIFTVLGSSNFGLSDKVTFGLLNVFGRQLDPNPTIGRSHNGAHHLGILIGKNVNPGVVGGIIQQADGSLRASGISSATGAADDANGDVPFSGLLGAYGKTMGAVLGVPKQSVLDDQITTGSVVQTVVSNLVP